MAHAPSGVVRRCSRCGCAEHEPCFLVSSDMFQAPDPLLLIGNERARQIDGLPCCWIGPELCSACATVAELLESRDGFDWLLTALGMSVRPPLVARNRGVVLAEPAGI